MSISNFQFAPKVVRIKAGAEVTWQVKEGTHTVNADNGGFESPTLSAGQKFSHQFATARHLSILLFVSRQRRADTIWPALSSSPSRSKVKCVGSAKIPAHICELGFEI